jgi:hypothetical protein
MGADAEWSFALVPLGLCSWHSADGRPAARFPVFITSSLNVTDAFTSNDLRAWVLGNPLWNSRSVTAQLVDEAGNRLARVALLSPTFSIETLRQRRDRLIVYLTASARTRGTSNTRTARKLPLDTRFDDLRAKDLSDSPKFYSRTIPVRDALVLRVASVLAAATNGRSAGSSKRPSIKLLSLANSFVMEQKHREQAGGGLKGEFLSLILNDADVLSAGEAETFRADATVLLDRVLGYTPGDARLRALTSSDTVKQEDIKSLTEEADPNHLIALAVKDPFLAREFGLVTEWTCEISEAGAFPPGNEYHFGISLDLNALPQLANVNYLSRTTMFRLSDEVSPLPRNRSLGFSGAMAWLNGRSQGNDYRAIQVDADDELLKAWILQGSNTLGTTYRARDPSSGVHTQKGGPDQVFSPDQLRQMTLDSTVRERQRQRGPEAPQGLAGGKFGVNEPTSVGITFSACVDDLIASPVSAGGNPNALYWEDLAIGYRIDLARVAEGEHEYLSLHEQTTRVMLADKLTVFEGMSESYIEREQLAGDRPTSTEFARWSGIGRAQQYPMVRKKDGGQTHDASGKAVDLNPDKSLLPYTITFEAVDGTLPRLWYPNRYRYVVRNVFVGGVSISRAAARILLHGADTGEARRARHVQEFGFYRTEAFSCGTVLVPLDTQEEEPRKESEQTVYLTQPHQRRLAFVAPRALDLQQARFMGLIGSPNDNPDKLAEVALLTDPRTTLLSANGKPRDIAYFLDSQVTSVIADLSCLSSNALTPPSDAAGDGFECSVLTPWLFASERLKYSREPDWRTFRPITLKLVAAEAGENDGHPRARASEKTLEVFIPPGETVDISLVPDITNEDIKDSFFYQNARPHLPGPVANSPSIALPIVNEGRLRVIHTTPEPLSEPLFEFDTRYVVRPVSSSESPAFRMPRDPTSNKGFIVGILTIHAPTTGEIYFTATWADIHEQMTSPNGYALVEGQYSTPPRSIRFQEREPPSTADTLSLMSRNADRQAALVNLANRVDAICLENVVRFFVPTERPVGEDTGGAQYNIVEFNDGRRKLVNFCAVARARYAALYPTPPREHERESVKILVDVPNRNIPPQVRVREILPTFRDLPGETVKRTRRVASEVGLRVYIDPPVFGELGPGARCAVGLLEPDAYEFADARPYGSLWGEDPIEHPKLPVSTRYPKISDFATPDDSDAETLDPALYPNTPLVQRAEVVSDQVALAIESPSGGHPRTTNLLVASFALRYDSIKRCYFFDLLLREGFVGWLRLSLYLHQPHSLAGCYVSKFPTHAYAAILDESTVVQYQGGDWSVIRIGPVFDRTVSFLGYFSKAVAEGFFMLASDAMHFEETVSGNARFFSLRFKAPHRTLCVQKVRGGAVVGSLMI